MKFKVLEKTKNSVTVEFADKSRAVVPVSKHLDKEKMVSFIDGFHNVKEDGFDSVEAVPVVVGEEYEHLTVTKDYDYKTARGFHYPDLGDQLDALYWEREGDDTHRKAIDAQIKLIKEKISKGKLYKPSTVEDLLD